MKRHEKFLALALMLTALISVSSLAHPAPITGISNNNLDTQDVEINFAFDNPDFSKFKGYDIVKISGCSLTTNIGEPKLPVKTKIIFIPKSSAIVDIVVSTEKEEMEGNFTIYPTQPLVTTANVTTTNASFIVNHTIYNSSSPYPERIYEYREGYMVNRKIVVISVYPIQYIPKEGKILFHRNISISLKVKCSGVSTSSLIESEKGTEFLGTLAQDNVRYKYIIITGEELEESLNVLADWKTKKGVPASVFNLSWINSTYSGIDTQEKIRDFIRYAVQNWGTEWVLLGGDTDIVPYRGAYGNVSGVAALGGEYEEDSNIPADLYYSSLNGTWDANGNSIYGEVEDTVDLFPTVFVGRASIDTVEEARTFVNKTLMYEKNPPVDYQLDILFLAEKLWNDPETYGGDAKDMIDTNLSYIPTRFTITKKYQKYGNASAPIAISEMNRGPHIVNHDGHGYYTGFSVNGWVSSSDANSLTNSPRNFILYTISCMSNGFDHHDSVSEHYMNNPDGGTVAYIGNSRYGWFEPGFPGEGPSDLYDQQFFNFLFNYSIYNIGAILACSKIVYIMDSQEDGNGMRWLQYAINLLGDPELQIWTENPRGLNVSYECNYNVSETIDIRVKSKPEGEPVEGALVCLQGKNAYVYGYTNSDGEIIFEISSESEEEINLTVTKHNFLPFEGVIGGSIHDVYIESNYTGAYDTGIRIDNATAIVQLGQNLTIGESYYIKYKVVNNGTAAENGTITVKLSNATGWSAELANYSQFINVSDFHDGNVTWNTAVFAAGIYNITVNASISSEDARPENNVRTREVMLEMPPPGKPKITQWYPEEAIVNNTAGESRTFKVAINQTVNVMWYINGSVVHTNTSVPAYVNATYRNTSATVGVWNVSAIATNVDNNSDMHTWIWDVSSAQDKTPPIITNVTALNITANSVTIAWDTDEPSDSLVKYGVESGNYTKQTHNETEVISHTVNLTGLNANVTYYYVVNSTDRRGNANESEEHNFTTKTLVTELNINPEVVNPGDIITISGKTWQNESIWLSSSFELSLPVSEGKYSREFSGIHFIAGEKTFSVTAENVKNMRISVAPVFGQTATITCSGKNMTITVLEKTIYTRQLEESIDETGIAKFSFSFPVSIGLGTVDISGKTDIKVEGDAVDNATSVNLKVSVSYKVIADSNGNFSLDINTEGVPEGEYLITAGGIEKKVYVGVTPTPTPTPSPCFIATAAYGTPLHEDIDILREFRDEVLVPNSIGKAWVSTYYGTSPPIANALRENDALRTATRLILITPLVNLSLLALNGIWILFIAGLTAVILYFRREVRMRILKSLLVGTGAISGFIAMIFSLGYIGYTIPFCAVIGAYMLPFVIPVTVALMIYTLLDIRPIQVMRPFMRMTKDRRQNG